MSSSTPPTDGRAKLEDVARLARVSRSTASRAITGAPGVDDRSLPPRGILLATRLVPRASSGADPER